MSYFDMYSADKYFVKTFHDTFFFVDVNSNKLVHKKCTQPNVLLVLDGEMGALYIPDKCVYISSFSEDGGLEYSSTIKYFEIPMVAGKFSIKIGDWFLSTKPDNTIAFSQQQMDWETFVMTGLCDDVVHHFTEIMNRCDMIVYSIKTHHQTIGYVNEEGFLVHANKTINSDSLFKMYIVKNAVYAYLCIIKDKTVFYIKDVDYEGRAVLSFYPHYISFRENSDNTIAIIIDKKYLVAHVLGRFVLVDRNFDWGCFNIEEDGSEFASLVGGGQSNNNISIDVNIMNMVDTLKYIKKNKCSISRYGDGEFRCMLMLGDMNNYQMFDNKLAYMLLAALNSSSDKILICLPNIIKNPQGWWKEELVVYHSALEKIIPQNCVFGDAFVSRFYDALEFKKNEECSLIVSLWKEIFYKRKICIVEGEYSRVGVGNDLLNGASSIDRIIAPATNAFEKYEVILDFICRNVSKDSLILLAIGQTASVMAPVLSNMGYQALDIGHLDVVYEWYLQGAVDKIQIKGKWVNEAGGMSDASFPSQKSKDKYFSEIMYIIK